MIPAGIESPAAAVSQTTVGDADNGGNAGNANNNVNQFHEQAVAAFQQGNYRDATHLAAHAAVDDPKNPTVHLLLVLGMFATGEYRGAAMEAHAVALLGKTPGWSTVYEFYGDLEPYTKQLRHSKNTPARSRNSPRDDSCWDSST